MTCQPVCLQPRPGPRAPEVGKRDPGPLAGLWGKGSPGPNLTRTDRRVCFPLSKRAGLCFLKPEIGTAPSSLPAWALPENLPGLFRVPQLRFATRAAALSGLDPTWADGVPVLVVPCPFGPRRHQAVLPLALQEAPTETAKLVERPASLQAS